MSSLYLLTSKVRVQSGDMGKRWIPTYNVTPTLTHPSRWRSPTSRDRLYQSSRRHPRTYILTYLFQKTNFSKIFRTLSGSPRGSTPTSSNSTPRATYARIFFRLFTLSLTNDFTQSLPTSTSTTTPTPSSDPTPRVMYHWIFYRHPTCILTKCFTQALPTSTATHTPKPYSYPSSRVTYRRIFPASLPPFKQKVLLRQFQIPPPPTLQRHLHIPHLLLRTLQFFSPLYHIFSIRFYSGTPNLQR